MKEAIIEFTTRGGIHLEGRVARLGRYEVGFETVIAEEMLAASDVLPTCKIRQGDTTLYEGRATLRNVIHNGGVVVCEVALDERGLRLEALRTPDDGFESFARQWLAGYRIAPEFKIVVSDVAILLSNVRNWLDQVELGIGVDHNGSAGEGQDRFVVRMAPRVIESFNALHERFEDLAYRIDPELRGVHRAFVWRQWSPFFLCTPFGYRTYYKPLGYAGDYEMMNMIHRNGPEGSSLFAKVMHSLLVSGWPAESVRNRIAHLKNMLVAEVARVAREGRRARVLSVGCGPAWEAQDFMRDTVLASRMDLTLLDFNQETLDYAAEQIASLNSRAGRMTGVEVRHVSVHQLLRTAVRRDGGPAGGYDVVYCAGLFDYLSEATCKALVNTFYGFLAPGGLVVVANMHDAKPFRNFIEFLLDWHLIYRDSRQIALFRPDDERAEVSVIAEPTAVNLFVHARKPA
jgi:extracellular factor (EF) 3-hydroxypalmitic acid methyl ester biosynthesis protein